MAQTTELQQGLNEVVMNKVQRMIDGKAVGVRATMERLVNEGKIAQDYIAPIGVNLKINDHNPVITFSANGSLRMDMPDGQFTLHDNAIGQLADRMGIPQRYLRGLASGEPWAKQLAATLLNEHSGWTQRSEKGAEVSGSAVYSASDQKRSVDGTSTLYRADSSSGHARRRASGHGPAQSGTSLLLRRAGPL